MDCYNLPSLLHNMAYRDRQVTYSPASTLVPTYECFNRCTYCNFRVDPGQDRWLSLAEAAHRLRSQSTSVCEVLILSGEVHPASARRSAWIKHIYQLGELALTLGFLPHTNAGPLSFEEMACLKQVNVSMGLMLEQLTPALGQTVHRYAPSKRPEVRLQQLAWAGELRIPFTTGLLLGIGETEADRVETLRAIAATHRNWGHIQEVILQPHNAGRRQLEQHSHFSASDLVQTVALARDLLPKDIVIQVPPNLIHPSDRLVDCLAAGARDLGGISPHDEVNPDFPHYPATTLTDLLKPAGWQLVPRLPVYPQYDNWLVDRLHHQVKVWRDRIQFERTGPCCSPLKS